MGGLMVLVVEDDAEIRGLMVDVLSGRGHCVLAVGGGEGAEAVVGGVAVDVVLVDLMLGDVSGLELVERLGAVSGARMVAMSASQLLVAEAVLWPEFAGFLAKPFTIGELVAVVEGSGGG